MVFSIDAIIDNAHFQNKNWAMRNGWTLLMSAYIATLKKEKPFETGLINTENTVICQKRIEMFKK